MDIAFLPFVPSDHIYFCLECKRLNVLQGSGVRAYFVEYVRFGMLRFVTGQYASAVRHGGMLGFVLNGDVAGAMAGIENNIRRLHQILGMTAPGIFQTSGIRPTDAMARETWHWRSDNPDAFLIHHLFMPGTVDAPLQPVTPPPMPSAVKQQRKGKHRKRK